MNLADLALITDAERDVRALTRRLESTTNPATRFRLQAELTRARDALARVRADAAWAQGQREIAASWRAQQREDEAAERARLAEQHARDLTEQRRSAAAAQEG